MSDINYHKTFSILTFSTLSACDFSLYQLDQIFTAP